MFLINACYLEIAFSFVVQNVVLCVEMEKLTKRGHDGQDAKLE